MWREADNVDDGKKAAKMAEMDSPYTINVMSDGSYENLVAEIAFRDKDVGIILSQEHARDRFEISVYSLIEGSRQLFFDTEKNEKISIDLSEFLTAIDAAKQRLVLLDEPR